MTGSDSLSAYLAEVNHGRARLGYWLAAVLMPGGVVLDWITHPSKLAPFLFIRLAASAVALLVLAFVPASTARRHPVVFGAGPPLICGLAIEAMITELEGYSSAYYAGLNLCILSVGVLYNWHWAEATILCGLIVGIWLAPTIGPLASGGVDLSSFVNNTYFLVLTSVISVASTVGRYRLAAKEFASREKLARTSSELAATLEELKHVDRLKSEFFANISHELRTPLTLILAPIDDLLSDPALFGRRDALLMIRRSAQRLLRLIEDLLDLARLDARGLRLRVGPFDPGALVRNIVDACGPAALAKSIRLAFIGPPYPIKDLYGDPHRIEIVVTNLVGNALKFTPAGGEIRVTVAADDRGATVTVEDNGPGIAPADHHRVFERFYQVEGSARRQHGGAGIGLALARELVELHDGALTVASELGKGATFRMWLPSGADHFRPEVIERRRVVIDTDERRRAEDRTPAYMLPAVATSPAPSEVVSTMLAGSDRAGSEAAAAPGPDPIGGARESPYEVEQTSDLDGLFSDAGRRSLILLAEDEPDLRDFVRTVLERHFNVVVAADGPEAIEIARRERPDLVLADVMMPKMSGIDLCRALRDDASLGTTPIILLTARSGTDATLEGYGAGADDFIPKPFHPRVLLARVRAQLKIRALGLRLAAQARLATAGTLAAGVAHEVRNPLNAVINAVAVLRKPNLEEPLRERMLDLITDGADRIHQVLCALDDQVRPADGTEVSIVDVRVGLDATLELLSHRLGSIAVHRRYATQRRAIGSARELNQVFLNLLDNAVRIAPRNIWVDVTDEGDAVHIAIGDDGPGVPPDIADRIFDPFYTTRPVGEGTGLGLYISRKLLKARGGEIALRTRSGGGAEFVVQVPGASA